jgi:hypothetical protein
VFRKFSIASFFYKKSQHLQTCKELDASVNNVDSIQLVKNTTITINKITIISTIFKEVAVSSTDHFITYRLFINHCGGWQRLWLSLDVL